MFIGAEEYAVVVPVVNKEYFLFEIRSNLLRIQPGEISFPGGKIEYGESPKSAAIRETVEEIGVRPNIISNLPPVYTPFNIIIHPFIGILESSNLNINKYEVEKTIEVPIEIFKSPKYTYDLKVKVIPPSSFPFHLIPNGKDYKWRSGKYKVMFFEYNDHIIWGMTALIAHEAYKKINEKGEKQ